MRLQLKIIVVIVAWTCGMPLKAQLNEAPIHYFDLQSVVNPAAVGADKLLHLRAEGTLSFAGAQRHPRTFYVAADTPLPLSRQQHGVGVQWMRHRLDLTTQQQMALQYAYRFPLGQGTLAAGAQIGLLTEMFDGEKLALSQPHNPAWPTSKATEHAMTMGVGVYYAQPLWFAGFAVHALNAPTLQLTPAYAVTYKPLYSLVGGYDMRFRNPHLTLKTSALLQATQKKFRADVTARMVYQRDKKQVYGGLTYSPTHAVTALVGGTFHGVVLGYHYEYYTSGSNLREGRHGCFVGYQTEINVGTQRRGRHQSIRIL